MPLSKKQLRELEALQTNPDLIDDAVCAIYDDAVESADTLQLLRIKNVYPPNYLDFVLGGYPDFLDELSDEGEI